MQRLHSPHIQLLHNLYTFHKLLYIVEHGQALNYRQVAQTHSPDQHTHQWLVVLSTEVELFVLIGSDYSVEFALQFGKAWNRSFVGRDFCNRFVLIRDSGLCLL